MLAITAAQMATLGHRCEAEPVTHVPPRLDAMEVPVNRRPAVATRIQRAAWAVAATCALVTIPSAGASAVTDSNDSAASAPVSTTLPTAHGVVTLDLRDTQAIASALRNFLETDPSAKSVPMLEVSSGAWLRSGDTPFIDSRGFVRIGLWLLQARGDDLVLIYREPGAASGKVAYQYVVSVGRDAQQRWSVSGITWEKLLAR